MKKLRYVSTCVGGRHHKFRDDTTGETVDLSVDELDEAKKRAKDIKDENDDFEASLPAFLKNRPAP